MSRPLLGLILLNEEVSNEHLYLDFTTELVIIIIIIIKYVH